MKRLLNNPFASIAGYQCFGCSPDNNFGLQMEFTEEEDGVSAIWQPKSHFEGWKNILHGGIQATLMDEIASWLVFVKLHTSGVTSKMEVKLSKPVHIDRGEITLKATLRVMQKNVAVIDTSISNADGIECATAVMYYFTYPEKIAREKLWYPGHENF
ncbi:MAG: PaaI family thioesterase [Lentimicrobium sp.]|jgi:acyl-coenzyme A thioesterase PaaI-like protein|nr:PaaI family thioesterase [Lentimicrobium sp.]